MKQNDEMYFRGHCATISKSVFQKSVRASAKLNEAIEMKVDKSCGKISDISA